MNIAEYSIEKKTVVYLFALILLIGGYIGFNRVGRLEDPDFTITSVKVITKYPGATPSEVEEEVSDIIEEWVQKIPEVEYVESESSYGSSVITVKYLPGYSAQEYRQLYDELRKKIGDAQVYLPKGAGPSWVNDDFKDVYGIQYAIIADGYSLDEMYHFAEEAQKELLLVDGVSKVGLMGEPKEVVYVEISRSLLASMGLSQEEIYSLIQYQNQVVDAGTVYQSGERLRFNVTGDFDTVEALGDIVIASKGGANIYLSDISEIYRGYLDPPTSIVRYNGQRAIGIGVSVNVTENVVEVGNRIDARWANMAENIPIGIEFFDMFNQPNAVKKSVNNFVISLFQSVIIVVALLLIFMGLQSGIIIGFILLLIIAGTLLFMYIFNITLQRISLGALIIAMGMLVDNSIVVTEGILVRYQRGEDRLEAPKKVVSQTMWPLFGATIVAIFAFASVGLSQDGTGEYTKTLFWVIIISLMISWVLAITLNPLICYNYMHPKLLGEEGIKKGHFMKGYEIFLGKAIEFKWVSLAIVLFILGLSFWGFRFVDMSFFPLSSQPQFAIDYWMPEGTDIKETEKGMIRVEKELLDKEKYPYITRVSTFVGTPPLRFQLPFSPETPNGKYGMFLVEVDDYKLIPSLVDSLQRDFETHYVTPMMQVIPFELGPGGKGALKTRIYGSDPVELRKIAQQVRSLYAQTDNAIAIRDSWGERIKVLDVEIDEYQARQVGITRPQINQAIKQAFDGLTVGVYREDNKQMPIISIPKENERSDISSVNDIYVYSSILQKSIPITQLVKKSGIIWNDKVIGRRDRIKMIEVVCDPREGEASTMFNQVRPLIEAIDFPPGYFIEFGGQYEDSKRANESILKTLPLAILAMFLTIIVLWNRVKQPIIIFLSVPLSFIGVTLGLLLTGLPFSFMAIMGLLALFGMVIKNSIVLVDEFDLEMKEGKDPFMVILAASSSRVRPVMMAALSTVLGMIPLLGDSFFQSMAITIMFGLTIASVITLVVIPVLYAIFFGVKRNKEIS